MAGGKGFFILGVRLGLRFYYLGLRFQILVSRYFGAFILYPLGIAVHEVNEVSVLPPY